MATVVQLKRSAVPGKVPDAANLAVGELAINFADGLIYSKNTTNEVVVVASLSTSNIFEGTNLYFTNARAVGAFTAGNGINIDANGLLTVTVSGAASAVDSVNGLTGDVVLTTANISESGNLYYTDERVYSNVVLLNYATTSFVLETANLKANISDLTTDNVSELNNLYFTNARVYANVVAGGFATEGYVNTQISNLVDSSPEALDTLNELAAALGNDNNFATTTVTLIGSAYNQANAAYNQANTATTDASTATTNAAGAFDQANVATTNASSAFDTANLKANITDLTTANVSELTNLYFTNARAVSALTSSDTVIVESNGYISANVVAGLTAGYQIVIDSNGLITANVVGGGGGGGASVTVATSPPGSASEGDLYWDEELGKLFIYYTDGDSSQWVDVGIPSITSLTTANVVEVDNLYYTDERVYANISPLLNTGNIAEIDNLYFSNARVYSNILLLDTDSISEGTNLYYTDERVYANVTLLSTDNISEGANLYYTNARVQAYLEASGNIIPDTDNTYNLGSPTNKYKELYLSGNSIYLDNVVIKSSGNEIQFFRSDGETRASIANTPSNNDVAATAAALAIALGG